MVSSLFSCCIYAADWNGWIGGKENWLDAIDSGKWATMYARTTCDGDDSFALTE